MTITCYVRVTGYSKTFLRLLYYTNAFNIIAFELKSGLSIPIHHKEVNQTRL